MIFFFGSVNSGGAPGKPDMIVSRNGNTSTTLNYTFNPNYYMGKGTILGEAQNQFCSQAPSGAQSCLAYTVNNNIQVPTIFQPPVSFDNTAGPITPGNLVYWNVRITNQWGRTAVYRTQLV